MNKLTLFGLFAVTAMVVLRLAADGLFWRLQLPVFLDQSMGSCNVHGCLGLWEAIWSLIAARRWWLDARIAHHGSKINRD